MIVAFAILIFFIFIGLITSLPVWFADGTLFIVVFFIIFIYAFIRKARTR